MGCVCFLVYVGSCPSVSIVLTWASINSVYVCICGSRRAQEAEGEKVSIKLQLTSFKPGRRGLLLKEQTTG